MGSQRPGTGGPVDWSAIRHSIDAVTGDRRSTSRGRDTIQALLDRRARWATGEGSTHEPAGSWLDVLTFPFDGASLGIDLALVRSVSTPGSVTAVPFTPDHILGITVCRGEIVALIDLARVMGRPDCRPPSGPRLVVLGAHHGVLGLLLSEPLQIARLETTQCQEPPASLTSIPRALVRAVAPNGLIVLDASAILSDRNLVVEREP